MPRPRSIPSYRLHKSSGQAIVEINGKTHYLGAHGTKASKLEYDRIISEYMASHRSPMFGRSPAGITVADVFLAFIRYAKEHYGTNRKSKYHDFALLIKRLADTYGPCSANDFGAVQFRAVRDKLVELDHSRNYVNAEMKRLVRIFKWAASESLISTEVPTRLAMIECLRKGKSKARETDPVCPVPNEVVDKTLKHLPQVVADIVRLQRLTGARPSEICNLKASDFDQTSTVWLARLGNHKNAHRGKPRSIFFGPKAQEVLKPYIESDPVGFVFSPAKSEEIRLKQKSEERKTPLSCGNRRGTNKKANPKRVPGDRYQIASYRWAIYRACDKAGVERWSPNQLRHLYATEIRKEHGLEAASILLGHAKPDTTLIYAERDEQKARNIAAQVG